MGFLKKFFSNTNETDISLNDLLAQAEAALAQGDYRQAIEHHWQILEDLSRRNRKELSAFREGPFAKLLMAAAYHTMELSDRNHYIQALDLASFIEPYFENAEEMAHGLAGIKKHCTERVLYTRSSPKATDVLICCAEAELKDLQAPLAAALQKLGVLVAKEPFVITASQPDVSLTERLVESDALVVLVSPDLFSGAWPQAELLELLSRGGESAVMVIPVWHRIERVDVKAACEPLSKTLAFDTDKDDIARIAQNIADTVRPDLASGSLHKITWSALWQGKTLGEAETVYELPVRHASLDEAQIARVRLIRAAFLHGNRQTMASWVESFSRDLEPDSAIVEWEKLAQVFHDALSLQRALQTNPEATLAQMLPEGVEESNRIRMSKIYMEFAGYPPDKLFTLVWFASQPMAGHLDSGYPPEFLGLINLFFKGMRLSPGEADFVTQHEQSKQRSAKTLKLTDWSGTGVDFNTSILHTEEERPWSKPWDVFISHASEDKAQLVRPLADALEAYGVKVWLDAFNLRPGLILSQSIDAGIAGAEFGIVVISPYFITKKWPRIEFDTLSQRQAKSDRLIALWHNLPPENRPEWTQALDPEKSLDTADLPITALTMQVLEWVRPDLARFIQRKLAYHATQEQLAQDDLKTKSIKSSELKLPPRFNERLPAVLVDRVNLLRAVLSEVYPHTLEYWLEGFLRDYRPEANIADWERLAAMYQEAVNIIDYLQQGTEQQVSHTDVFRVIDHLTSPFVSKDKVLQDIRQKFPENIVNVVLNIIASPIVIEVLE